MPVFACKESFASLGLEQMKPSHMHAYQDCTICKEPLSLQLSSPSEHASKHHSAVRIIACGHIAGEQCLNAWLDIGHSCPTCSRVLFEPTGDEITQEDADNIILQLRPKSSDDQIMTVIARLVAQQNKEIAQLHRCHEQEVAKMRSRAARGRKKEFALAEEDVLDEEEETDFDEYDDDANIAVEKEESTISNQEAAGRIS